MNNLRGGKEWERMLEEGRRANIYSALKISQTFFRHSCFHQTNSNNMHRFAQLVVAKQELEQVLLLPVNIMFSKKKSEAEKGAGKYTCVLTRSLL